MESELVKIMKIRAGVLAGIRDFFSSKGYIEADVPLLTPAVIPEAAIELFSARQVTPWGTSRDLFLLPSPEYYLKQLIAGGSGNIFSISRSFRNSEQSGRQHNPEFSMLEWYTMGADYMQSISTAEAMIDNLIASGRVANIQPEAAARVAPPFERISMTEAFSRWADFDLSGHCTGRLSAEEELRQLHELAARFGLSPSADSSWEELFNLVFVHQIEPSLPEEKAVVIYNYPAGIPALAKPAAEPGRLERWELYSGGTELANCYSEETGYERVRSFFDDESAAKKAALVAVKSDYDWCNMYRKGFPECSGTALGLDRLMMLLSGSRSLGGVILFPLSDTIADL